MKFEAVKWQDDIINSIRSSILNDRLGHAMLLCGSKEECLTLAHATADALLCEEKNATFCGKCSACIKLNASTHPDKIIVTPKKASMGVEEIREFSQNVYVKPYFGGRKIYIFTDADKLTIQAQNALLKLLEAPPSYALIIMIAPKEEDLLPTVLSRLIKYTLRLPTWQQVAEFLAGKYPEKREMATFCARFSDGNPVGAEQLIKNDGFYDKRRRMLIFLGKLTKTEKSVVFDFANYLTDAKDEFEQNLSFVYSILRDCSVINAGLGERSVINTDLLKELTALAKRVNNGKISNIIEKFSKANENIGKNASFALTITNTLLGVWEEIHD